MYALRVAAGTNRVLLIHWEHPGNLTDFLVPGSGIDWRWQGTPAVDTRRSSADADVLGNRDVGKAFPDTKLFAHDPSNKTFLVLKTNYPAEASCEMCPGVEGKPAEGYDFVCMFRYGALASMFKDCAEAVHVQFGCLGSPPQGCSTTCIPQDKGQGWSQFGSVICNAATHSAMIKAMLCSLSE
jgi:hypothetical protein